MLNKPFFLFIFLLILAQVSFSFYYSSEIINQNNLIDQSQTTYQALKIKNQELEENLATSSSLTHIRDISIQKNYIDLKDNLSLQN